MRAAPDGQEQGRSTSETWEMPGPITDRLLIAGTALALSVYAPAGSPGPAPYT
jgi:hypothetical protein